MSKLIKSNPTRTAFWVLLIFASTALVAALTLSIEEVQVLRDPNAILSCNFNLVLNCATVMKTWQASVFFGMPNMFVGLMAFPVLITVAVSVLWGGATFKRGFLLAMNAGVLLCAVFAYWLFFNSLYDIQVLCPWCLVVTTSSTLLLAASLFIGLHENIFKFKKSTNEKIQKFLKSGYYPMVVAGWVVLMIALVFIKFGEALFT